ncbi:hypothetical protein QBC47DRAFT_409691 [Echria macrotheca]|uniref:DUF6536 domain-containing protein n=1 Tax=Echria macrotheca TaxID=438768 RepID=A0AAJ0BKM7_9PEZI|nr:hypothetical protein QBC47DRAFT_409691 [Echria macrotheca]
MSKSKKGSWSDIRRFFSKQHVLLWTAFLVCFFVFLLNLSLAVVAHTKLTTDGQEAFVRDLYKGDCENGRYVSLAAHAIINFLSTLMLWASNLAMQLTTAPTRKEIDAAHKQGKWFDVGVLSWHNLWSVPAANRLVWFLLASTSVPIHLLYNSVVFGTLNANEWRYFAVTQDFFEVAPSPRSIDGPRLDASRCGREPSYDFSIRTEALDVASKFLQDYLDRKSSYTNASMLQCLERFNNPFVYRPNAFLVNKTPKPGREDGLCWPYGSIPNSDFTLQGQRIRSLRVAYPSDSFSPGTLCQRLNRSPAEAKETYCGLLGSGQFSEQLASEFALDEPEVPVDYCIYDESITPANEVQHQCRLQCSPVLLFVVTLFNFIKCGCILWFLKNPDDCTQDLGVATKSAITKNSSKGVFHGRGGEMQWRTTAVSWWNAVERRTWATAAFLFLGVMASAAVCIAIEVIIQKTYRRDATIYGLWRLGFGQPRYESLISWGQPETGVVGLVANLAIANMWQVLVSILFTTFNIILASQLVALEWSKFADTRKPRGLRVSRPERDTDQRSTYWLSMPFRYILPIMVAFYFDHFLLSQSSFVIRLLIYNWDGTQKEGRTLAGFSPIPGQISLVVSFLLFAAYVAISFRRYPADPRMPLVGTNSLAIAANCQVLKDDDDRHLRRVAWGVPRVNWNDSVKVCTFTSGPVRPPVDGEIVRGLEEEASDYKRRRGWVGSLRRCFGR